MGGWFAQPSISSKYIAPNIRFFIKLQSNKCLHFISHTFLLFNNLFFEKSDLTLYSTLFFSLYETFSHVFIPHPLLLTFFRFERRFFLTIYNLFTLKHPNWKMTTKKGITIPLKNQCMSCPISMVSILTIAGGYKLFSGLLYWSEISVSGGWMLCTIHKLFYCLLSFLDSIISNVGREICWSM